MPRLNSLYDIDFGYVDDFARRSLMMTNGGGASAESFHHRPIYWPSTTLFGRLALPAGLQRIGEAFSRRHSTLCAIGSRPREDQ
jgi:hypothetical protein